MVALLLNIHWREWLVLRICLDTPCIDLDKHEARSGTRRW